MSKLRNYCAICKKVTIWNVKEVKLSDSNIYGVMNLQEVHTCEKCGNIRSYTIK